MTKGTVGELRASLGLLETAREAAHSELHNAQQLIIGASSLFLLSLAFGVGPSAPSHLELGFRLSHGARQWAKLIDERVKVLVLQETAEKVRAERDHLWQELEAEAKVMEEARTALAERELELDVLRVELRRLMASAGGVRHSAPSTASRGPLRSCRAAALFSGAHSMSHPMRRPSGGHRGSDLGETPTPPS